MNAQEAMTMPNDREEFRPAGGIRRILVAEDEMINRELLGLVLEEHYEIVYAENGRDAVELIRARHDEFSLVLLDLMMPELSGMDVLRIMRDESLQRKLPVIVMTADAAAEVECLRLGAVDFIPKPYPDAAVILARILRTIELYEDRDVIRSAERDPLTGLFNREFFFHYARQLDLMHPEWKTDAMTVNVNRFHLLNERFGTPWCDALLRRIGEQLDAFVTEEGGLACRREADTFLIYCPHREDYEEMLRRAASVFDDQTDRQDLARLRMGIYACADKTLDIERRFDRAQSAADTLHGSYAASLAVYDDALHEKELYHEQLLEDFHTAIREKQFVVYYQPKYNIRPAQPRLASAEALIRWQHPRFGFISPGEFIPLLEENGLVQPLDHFVWQEAAAQIRRWKDQFGISIPVSVNVSLVDMFDPGLFDFFKQLLADNDLQPEELLLEITESAYTEESSQIIDTVNRLRELGFHIEMDDFGSGYSSLNMISSLPIDALKLDMQFVRSAFRGTRDTRLLEIILDIAEYLRVPTIAEGVETEEQLWALKAMGCDVVQGYYFSKPVPPEEFERFIRQRLEQDANGADAQAVWMENQEQARAELSQGKIAEALSGGFDSVYYVDTDSGYYVQFSADGRYEDLEIRKSGKDFFADARRNVLQVVWEGDRERVSRALEKDYLLSNITEAQPYIMYYRLVINRSPLFYRIKAVRAGNRDDHHIVIAISNVDDAFRAVGV